MNISTEVAHPDVYMVMQDDYVLGQMLADRLAEVVPDGGGGILIAGPGQRHVVKEAHSRLLGSRLRATPTYRSWLRRLNWSIRPKV